MTEPDPSATLHAYFRELRRAPVDHPSPDDLVAYRSGRLEPGREEEIRGHLVACEECSELILELAELERSPDAARGEISGFEMEAAWRKLHLRLQPGRRSSWAQLGGWAAAACLLLIVGALSYELRELRRTLAAIYDQDLPRVIADEQGRRGLDDELPILELEPGRPGIVLLLLERVQDISSFRVEFFSEDGDALLIRDGLAPSENLLLVPVTLEVLPEGRIRAVVSGLRGQRWDSVEEYVFRVHHF